jgi:predicted ATPase
MPQLDRITVRGYKSIRALESFELRRMNVLIGANGAGKSNFISVFRLLAEVFEQRLQLFVQQQDGPDALLFGTRKRTEQLEVELHFARNGYRFALVPAGKRLVFASEETYFRGDFVHTWPSLGSGHEESRLPESDTEIARHVRDGLVSRQIYHFHDTSTTSPLRQKQAMRENLLLKPDASNLAPFLHHLRGRDPERYRRILEVVRRVAPFFGDFVHREDPGEQIELEWYQADDPDTVLGPRQLSDGTLRFICLATLLVPRSGPLLQRGEPATILIDEPELGLHPFALSVLAALMRQASERRQLIVSTQSVELVNEFAPEDVVVVSRRDGASELERLDAERLREWLEDLPARGGRGGGGMPDRPVPAPPPTARIRGIGVHRHRGSLSGRTRLGGSSGSLPASADRREEPRAHQ